MKFLSTLFFAAFCSFGAFAQANSHVVISFDHKVGSEPLVLGQTEFLIWNGKKVKLTRAEFYVSEIGLHTTDNGVVNLADQYLLVDASAPAATFDLGNWGLDAANAVTLHLGVPQSVNHLDPTTYPANHALALHDPTMHWGWTSGYRFMAIEGKVDNNNDGVPETSFEYHNLGDGLYKTVELTGSAVAANGDLQVHFVLDYAKLFQNMSMTGNLIQHGSSSINNTMMNNAVTQGFINMAGVSATQNIEANSNNVSASPNPFAAHTLITFDLPATQPLVLVLSNTLGQTVAQYNDLPAKGTQLIEKGSLPNGNYQYGFYENGKLIARKQLIINE